MDKSDTEMEQIKKTFKRMLDGMSANDRKEVVNFVSNSYGRYSMEFFLGLMNRLKLANDGKLNLQDKKSS